MIRKRKTLKPPPTSRKDLQKEALALGLVGTNPKIDTKRKELVKYIYESANIQRAYGRASILLVGSSGVGKSSTVNHLFGMKEADGVNFAKTSDQVSETRVTTEYEMKADSPEYEVSDLKLGLVDSPGFNDTDGMRQDACNFYSIKRFYETHPLAKSCFPNLIFVMINAGDTRIDGPNSNLTKSLKCLQKLNLVDTKHPNVVGVMTHACHLGRNAKRWKEKFEAKKAVFKRILFKHLNVAADVVALENCFEDEDLETDGYCTVLPDKETTQPRNLYKACADLFRRNGDVYGHLVFRAVFGKNNHEPIKGHAVAAKNAKKEQLNREEQQFLDFFEKTALGDGIEDPLFKAANDFIAKNNLDNNKNSHLQDLTSRLKSIGVEKPDDCKLLSHDVIRFMTEKDLDGEDELKQFLEVLRVKEGNPCNLDDGVRLLGQGYNLLNDRATDPVIFKYNMRNTKCGVLVPAPAKFSKVIETHTFMEQFDSHESMMNSRMTHLNVSLDVNYKQFAAASRAGFNTHTSSSASGTSKEYSFLLEQRMFEVSMGNFAECSFTKDFKKDVEKLPLNFSVSDKANRQQFEKFFGRWGHCVVTKAFGGGSLEMKINSHGLDTSSDEFASTKAELTAALHGGSFGLSASMDGGSSTSFQGNTRSILSQSTKNWLGGDHSFHNDQTLHNQDQMIKWKLSLMQNPVMLSTDMSVIPISVLVETVEQEKEKACYDALENFLGGKFQIQKKEEEMQEKAAKEKEKAEARTREEEAKKDKLKSKGSCFPGVATVTVLKDDKECQIPMLELCIGDMVKTIDTGTRLAQFTPVIFFAHRDTNISTCFKKIQLKRGGSITLSSNHLLFMGEGKKTKMAEQVLENDEIILESGEVSQVEAIEDITETGMFCPVTMEGTILVEGVLASCYASCTNFAGYDGHKIAHLGLLPMRLLNKMRSSKPKNDIPRIHPYIQFLENLSLPWMA